jgi:hypothetical protein
LALGVDPGGVEIADTPIDGCVEYLSGLVLIAALLIHDALSAETEDGKGFSGFS